MDLSMTHTLLRMYLVTLAKADSLETPHKSLYTKFKHKHFSSNKSNKTEENDK